MVDDLDTIETVLVDIDHTVWHWDRLIPGVKETLDRLDGRGYDIFYVTNNSLLTRQGFADRLNSFGIDASKERIVSSPYVAATILEQNDVQKAYPIGEEALVRELEEKNIRSSHDADHVVVGVDRNFTYWKLAKAAEAVRDGAELWSTAHGSWFKAGDRHLPGTGALLSAIQKAAGDDTFRTFGKPSDKMCKVLEETFPIRPGRTLMVGDSISSDIIAGNKLGIDTGLVLGGKSTRKDIESVSGLEVPDYVFRDFKRLLKKL